MEVVVGIAKEVRGCKRTEGNVSEDGPTQQSIVARSPRASQPGGLLQMTVHPGRAAKVESLAPDAVVAKPVAAE